MASLFSLRWLCLLVVLTSGCSLELSGKAACSTQSDCLAGFSCVARTCLAVGGAGAPSVVLPAPDGDAGSADSASVSSGAGGAGSAGSGPVGGEAGTADLPDPCKTELGSCVPTLLDLVPSEGSLSPKFDPQHVEYSLTVPLLVDSLSFGVVASPGASVRAGQGGWLTSDGTLQALPLPLGVSLMAIEVATPGQPSRTYSVTVERAIAVAQSSYVKSSVNTAHGNFSFEIALDGDTLAVSNGTTGAVDIYTHASAGWAFQARVTASNGEYMDGFGFGLALSGDTLAVGAPFEDSAASGLNADQSNNDAINSGAVYIFTRKGNTWSERAYLKATHPQYLDVFGSELALAPDPEVSGESLLVVGAPCESSKARGVYADDADDSARDAGAVYVFGGSGANWVQRAFIKASNTAVTPMSQPGAQFGSTISLSGTRLAVGAPNENCSSTGVNNQQDNTNAPGSGAVYVFERDHGAWLQTAYVKPNNTHTWDTFGNSVAIQGTRLAVGAYWEHSVGKGVDAPQQPNPGDHPSGAVYVFELDGNKWSQSTFIKASNSQDGAGFGQAVALQGDLLAVTANREASGNRDPRDNSAPGAGAAYLFHFAQGSWVEHAYVKASNPNGAPSNPDQIGDGFGQGVCLSGHTLAVSAPYEASNATLIGGDQTNNASESSGAAYLFE